MIEKQCIICGKTFTAIRRSTKTCSAECSQERGRRNAAAYRDRNRIIRTEICPVCGKEFHPKGTQVYCSRQCANSPDKLLEAITIKCIVCGKPFTTYDRRRKTCGAYCSEERIRIRNSKDWKMSRDWDRDTVEFVQRWKRVPLDSRRMDNHLAALKEDGLSYADKQKAETIAKYARIKL